MLDFSTARYMVLRPNNEPMKTINDDMPTSSRNVFIRLAVGCQVIKILLGFPAD
jgi:hypothetical protein